MGSKKSVSKFRIIVISAIILEAVALLGIIIYLMQTGSAADSKNSIFDSEYGVKYVLYIGLNDKDTYVQEIPTEEAINIVNNICAEYAGGYTMQNAEGGWYDEKENLTKETSLVYILTDIDEDSVKMIMDDVISALDQNSILVERQDIMYTYYSDDK